MKTLIWKLRYGGLVVLRWPVSFFWNPWFVLRITLCRVMFTLTRKFVGNSFTSPITGEKIYNIQSLINAFAMQVVRELDCGDWKKEVRECAAPVVFDIGSNIGQFRNLILALNPGAHVVTVDPWPEMCAYVEAINHYSCAISDEDLDLKLQKSNIGLTASTCHNVYSGETIKVSCRELESIWEEEGRPEVKLLKIDVDGAECDVLFSLGAMLNHIEYILVEINSPLALEAFIGMLGEPVTFNKHDYLFCRDWAEKA